MNDLYKELYIGSIDDMRCMFMIKLSLEDMYRRHIHDGCGEILKNMIDTSTLELKRMIVVHNEKWSDDFTINLIKKTIVEGRMTAEEAKVMILYIENTQVPLNDWEQGFIDNISSIDHKLSARQSFTLRNIYERVTGGGRQPRQII